MTAHWIDLGPLAALPRQGARVVRVGEVEIAVFRTFDDAVFALANRCPHRGGPLAEGIVHGHSVACPLHDWKIDLESGRAHPPDEGCAARYPVRVVDGRIELALLPCHDAETCAP